MADKDGARARSEAVHQAQHDTTERRSAVRADLALQRYLAGVYYAVLRRGAGRRRAGEDAVETRDE